MQASDAPSTVNLAEAHARLLEDDAFQFEPDLALSPTPPEPPETPDWLRGLFDFLGDISPALSWIFWIGLAALAVFIVWLIVHEYLRMRRGPDAARPAAPPETASWRPTTEAARDLLAEADALAGRGDYAEAVHLILLRSVEDIRRHQPRAIAVSMTTREIGRLPQLPEVARPAFAEIGRLVERSLFGGADVSQQEFARCRDAYASFALADGAPA